MGGEQLLRGDKRVKSFLIILFVSLTVMSFTVLADPRIEVVGNFCHVPFDPADDDNESFLADCGGVVTVENQVADGFAVVQKTHIPLRALPIRPGEGETKAEIRLSGDDAGFTCTLVDSNGVNYQTTQWSVWTLAVQSPHPAMGDATYEVFCFNAAAVEAQ